MSHSRRSLHDHQLWDGTHTWCRGVRDGLPVWRWGEAPAGLVTRSQLRAQRLRLGRGQDPYGLLEWAGGRRTAELFRIDLAVPARVYSSAVAASVAAMCAAHRTCRRCGAVSDRYLPTSTWWCWPCMDATGCYGEPAAAA